MARTGQTFLADDAAIAGGLLGLRDTPTAIPARWLAVLQYADEFSAAADRLATC